MSSPTKDEWPETGELVVASVTRITNYGVYAMLDEYGKEGFLHISEISTGWVRNIRDYIREGEKVVLRVLRVDPERKHVDLSLRRVTKRERRERMLLSKRSKKAESLLWSASQRLGISLEEMREKTRVPLEEGFGEVYEGLERAAREGVEVLLERGLPREVAEVLTEVAKEKIRIPMVKVKGHLKISCAKPDGVLRVREALLKAKGAKIPNGADIKIYVVSTPKYRIEVTASDYKEANATMKRATETAIESIAKAGGEGNYERG
jgi:translation initiation factor 2 subunit 1